MLARAKKVPRNVKIGLVGVILIYVGVAGIDTAATPWWLGRGDAPRHIDYAYSLYHRKIPKFNDHLQFQKFNELANGAYRNQPAAINPPLFYVLHAPLIGPLFDSGQWHKGIALGKSFNLFLGTLCILSLSWAGWLFGGKRKELLAVVVPAIGGLSFNFTVLNDNYAVDVLLVLFSTLAFILSYKIMKNGLSKKYIMLLVLLSILGMGTKASYIVPLFVSLLSLPIASVLHAKKAYVLAFIKGCLWALVVAIVVGISVGWYYYLQNYRESGSWFSAAPESFGSNFRTYKTYGDVFTSSGLWGSFYEKIAANKAISQLFTTLALVGVIVKLYHQKFTDLYRDRVCIAAYGLMLIAVIGILATQIVQAQGYGNFYFRYFLPVLLPFALFFSYGLTQFKIFKGQLVTLAVACFSYTTLQEIVNNSAIKLRIPDIIEVNGLTDKINYATTQNGASNLVPFLLLTFILIGIIILALSLLRLSETDKSGRAISRT